MPMKRERDVKREVKNCLTKHGWTWWMVPMNGYGKSGISDIHALRHGVFMAIETKFDNVPTVLQKRFLKDVHEQSAFAFCVDEVNLSLFEAFMDAFDAATQAEVAKTKVSPEDGAMMLNAIKAMTEAFL